MRICNDPFKLILGIVRHRYPKARAKVFFVEKRDLRKGTHGHTWFPDDGGTPEIAISAHLQVRHAAEVLAHELAHAVLGPKPKGGPHGREWKRVFAWIHSEYERIMA